MIPQFTVVIRFRPIDKDRESAIAKMRSTLGEVVIEGVQTNLDFQYDILNQKDFLEGNVTTHFIEEHYE